MAPIWVQSDHRPALRALLTKTSLGGGAAHPTSGPEHPIAKADRRQPATILRPAAPSLVEPAQTGSAEPTIGTGHWPAQPRWASPIGAQAGFRPSSTFDTTLVLIHQWFT